MVELILGFQGMFYASRLIIMARIIGSGVEFSACNVRNVCSLIVDQQTFH